MTQLSNGNTEPSLLVPATNESIEGAAAETTAKIEVLAPEEIVALGTSAVAALQLSGPQLALAARECAERTRTTPDIHTPAGRARRQVAVAAAHTLYGALPRVKYPQVGSLQTP
jgi:hypothetical protein